MTSQWQLIVQEVNSNENKALLWSLLSEEQVFSGLGERSMQPVITLFETAIHTTINTYAQSQNTSLITLSNLNKDVIQRVIKEVANYKMHTATTSTSTAPYKSADIQEARIKDITSKVKVLENDMNAFLVLKKPPEIDFSDKKINDDAPIGDNMDQLIKDALAARERELEIIQFDIPPPPQQSPMSSDSATSHLQPEQSLSIPNKKTVSFETANPTDTDTDTDLEIGNIFNKLKRSQPDSSNQGSVSNRVPPQISPPMQMQVQVQLDSILNSIQELHSMVTALSSELQSIKNMVFKTSILNENNL